MLSFTPPGGGRTARLLGSISKIYAKNNAPSWGVICYACCNVRFFGRGGYDAVSKAKRFLIMSFICEFV